MKFFAKKVGMTHLYDEGGSHIPSTILDLQKTVVCGHKEMKGNGYEAVLYALIDEKAKPKKSRSGQFKKIENIKEVREQRAEGQQKAEIGNEIDVKSLSEGDLLTVFATTKGKGFAGTVKRHKFNTGPKTHGSHNYRQPGSIGDTGPAHVAKGKKMAGQMGNINKTVKDVKVIKIEQNLQRIWVKGAIPGSNNNIVILQK